MTGDRPKRQRMDDKQLEALSEREREHYRRIEFKRGELSDADRKLLQKFKGCFYCKELFAASHFPKKCPYAQKR